MSNCACGNSQSNCACGKTAPAPVHIKTCLPGPCQPVTWAAWTEQCWPRGMHFCVTDGPCPGTYIGTGAVGTAADRVMQRKNFSTTSGFSFVNNGCDVAVNFPDVAWDDICEAAESVAPDKPATPAEDETRILYCDGNGNVKKARLQGFLTETCYTPETLPADACDIMLLAYAVDSSGCGRFYRYNAGSLNVDTGRFWDVRRDDGFAAPASPQVFEWPTDFGYTAAQLYAWLDFRADHDGGSINEAKMARHRFALNTFTLQCESPMQVDVRIGIVSELQIYRGVVTYRRRKVGASAWIYPTDTAGDVVGILVHTAVMGEVNGTAQIATFDAGSWEVEWFVFPYDEADPVKYNFVDGETSLPRATLSKFAG